MTSFQRRRCGQPLITAVLITRIRCMFTTGFVVAQFFQTSQTSKYSSVTLHLKDRHKLHPNYFLKRKVDRLVSPLYVLCVKDALFEVRADKSQASRKHASFTWYPPASHRLLGLSEISMSSL